MNRIQNQTAIYGIIIACALFAVLAFIAWLLNSPQSQPALPAPTLTALPVEIPQETDTPIPTNTSIPKPTATPTPLPTATATPHPTATPTPIVEPDGIGGGGQLFGGFLYSIQPGDTLWDIAGENYGDPLRWPLICAANALSDCDLIHGGNELWLPEEAR